MTWILTQKSMEIVCVASTVKKTVMTATTLLQLLVHAALHLGHTGSPTWHLFHEASDETYFVWCDYLKSLCQLENPQGLLLQIYN